MAARKPDQQLSTSPRRHPSVPPPASPLSAVVGASHRAASSEVARDRSLAKAALPSVNAASAQASPGEKGRKAPQAPLLNIDSSISLPAEDAWLSSEGAEVAALDSARDWQSQTPTASPGIATFQIGGEITPPAPGGPAGRLRSPPPPPVVAAVPPRGGASGGKPQLPSLVGRTIAGCEVQELIGKGGFGVVYRGIHTVLDREAAVKQIHVDVSDHAAVERYLAEARMLAKLNHPNIVQIFDAQITRDGLVIVMEYVRGQTLWHLQRARGGRFEVGEALSIIRDAALALEAVGRQDLVHRDIKPANILVDEKGRAKVIDFGISSLRGDYSGSGGRKTFSGTPAYIAPERWQGDREDVRCDIYALGITLFELLTGHTPFRSEEWVEMMKMHLSAPVPAVSELRDDVSPDLDRVIDMMLAKNVEDRYRNPSALLDDLESVEAGDRPLRADDRVVNWALVKLVSVARHLAAGQLTDDIHDLTLKRYPLHVNQLAEAFGLLKVRIQALEMVVERLEEELAARAEASDTKGPKSPRRKSTGDSAGH